MLFDGAVFVDNADVDFASAVGNFMVPEIGVFIGCDDLTPIQVLTFHLAVIDKLT
jgi:hypothetical protein